VTDRRCGEHPNSKLPRPRRLMRPKRWRRTPSASTSSSLS
jgi:hypothetical protein